ncbi:S1 RNA-binding domain-containing protein [Candidatus Omnitrophota bacterium]
METNQKLNLGDIVEVEVTRLTDFGAFAKIDGRALGLIHISQIANSFVKSVEEHLKIGDKLKAKVVKLGPGKKIDLSLKLQETKSTAKKPKLKTQQAGLKTGGSGFKSSDFEDKFKQFLSSERTE